ncbi:MAG TPA: hypothetical protein VIJ41_02535 [Candidatus Nanopelagicales bacterium]
MTQTTTLPGTGTGLASARVCGIDVLSRTLREADAVAHAVVQELRGLGARNVVVATHVAVSCDLPHHTVTVSASGVTVTETRSVLSVVGDQFDVVALIIDGSFSGPPELYDGLGRAVSAHTRRGEGRVVVFPGDHRLIGTVAVADVIANTDVDRVRVITGTDADPATPLVTRDFVRPLWEDGLLVLHAQPAIGGSLVPFETPFPTPCCANHS